MPLIELLLPLILSPAMNIGLFPSPFCAFITSSSSFLKSFSFRISGKIDDMLTKLLHRYNVIKNTATAAISIKMVKLNIGKTHL